MRGVLPLLAVLSFILGVATQTLYDWAPATGLWFLFLGLVLALVWRRKTFSFSAPFILGSSLILLTFALGVMRVELASWQFGNSSLADEVGEEVELTGVVVSEPEEKARTLQLEVQVDEDKILVSTERLAPVTYGDEITVTGELEKPTSFVTDLGKTFDYAGYLKAKGIEYRISFADVTKQGSGAGNLILNYLLQAKQVFIGTINSIIPEPAAGLANGLLLGVKTALGEELETDFRKTGIIHIVVLSGYNVMLVVAFITLCFSFLLPLRPRLIAAVVAIIAFALIVGLSATVVRASIMAGLVLLAQFLGKQYDVLRGLILAGVLMVLLNPYILIYDIGFQLSFMATLGLILIIPHFESTVMQGKNLFGLKDFFLATLATQIAVLPLLLYHIGEISLVSVLVNVLVLPMVPVAMLLTFITGLLTFISGQLATLMGAAATFSLNYILVIASWFADLPFASVQFINFPAWAMLAYYLILLGGYWWLKRGFKLDDELQDWTIEDESKVADSEGSATNELPVFFR